MSASCSVVRPEAQAKKRALASCGGSHPANDAGEFVIGSFNFGINQQLLNDKAERVSMHLQTFSSVFTGIVKEGKCDVLFGCEVGGFRESFRSAGQDMRKVLAGSLGDSVRVVETNNYFASWGFQK